MEVVDIKAGELVKEMLTERSVSQAELGRRIGLTRAGVHNMLGRENMELRTLHRVADALGYDVNVTIKKRSNGKK
jgi:DNA-binding Xre family transcriptional regulator